MVTTRPAGQSYIIKRPRLTKMLDESQARVILLCAPAGYGKTTLAREWIATRKEPVAWYRGGPEMLDVAAVASALAVVLRAIGLPKNRTDRINAIAARSPDGDTLGHALASELGNQPGALLVVDDYQCGEESESDRLVSRLAEETGIRMLLTSRIRPTWVTARMCVYGEALVVERDDLAFTDEEANAVLGASKAPHGPEALKAAGGWPAVIGLAATRSDPALWVSERLMPDELYDYIANDMFSNTRPEVQRSLFFMALGGDASPEVARDLLGELRDSHLGTAESLGFLRLGVDSGVDLHPLVRKFLTTKLRKVDSVARGEVVAQVLTALANHQRWDECLNVLTMFPDDDACIQLLGEALPHLLATGRLATLRRWLTLSEANEDPVLLTAEAELALRDGSDARAQSLAERAGELSAVPELEAQAHLVAARAAHLRGDGLAARRNAQRVQGLSTNNDRRIDAKWIEFLSSFEDQDGEAQAILDQLGNVGRNLPDHALRLRWARAFTHLEVMCDVRAAVREVDLAHHLLPRVSDPLARTSFLNLGSSAAVYAGTYERAIRFADLQIQEAELSGLGFAAEHALATKAAALIGLREVTAAQRLLDKLEGDEPTSAFIQSQMRLKLARLRVTVGDLERAELTLRDPAPAALPRASYGEWFGSHAVYLAALGDSDAASRRVRESREVSRYIDTQSFTVLAEAIANLQSSPDAGRDASSAFTQVYKSGHLDALVTAFRACPKLVVEITQNDAAKRGPVTEVLLAARDVHLAKLAGLEVPREQRPRGTLSKRERDVLELIAAGRTYPQIASALFISASTTKVHVKHIFEKLGVRSRTEAALEYRKGRA